MNTNVSDVMGTSEVSIEYSGMFAAVAVAVTRCSGVEASPPPDVSAGRKRSEEGDDGGGRDQSICHTDGLCGMVERVSFCDWVGAHRISHSQSE